MDSMTHNAAPKTAEELAKLRKIMRVDEKLLPVLESLRDFVENLNRTPALARRGGTFRGLNLEQVYTAKKDGVEYGYQLKDIGLDVYQRNIYIKFPGYKIEEIPLAQAEAVMVAAFEALLDHGQGPVSMSRIADDCVLLRQQFSVVYWKEMNSNIIVPGKKH